MKINKIQLTNSLDFGAKLYPYPKTISNPKVFEMFEERTKDFPDFILKQDEISFFDRDYFLLLEKNKEKSFSQGRFSFTNNIPKTLEGIVDRLVEIFDILKKERLPKIVYKIHLTD